MWLIDIASSERTQFGKHPNSARPLFVLQGESAAIFYFPSNLKNCAIDNPACLINVDIIFRVRSPVCMARVIERLVRG